MLEICRKRRDASRRKHPWRSYATRRAPRVRKKEREKIMPINGIEIGYLAERFLDRSLVCISRAFRSSEVGEPRRVTFHAIVDTLTTMLAEERRVFPSTCRFVAFPASLSYLRFPSPRRWRRKRKEQALSTFWNGCRNFLTGLSPNFSSSRSANCVRDEIPR